MELSIHQLPNKCYVVKKTIKNLNGDVEVTYLRKSQNTGIVYWDTNIENANIYVNKSLAESVRRHNLFNTL